MAAQARAYGLLWHAPPGADHVRRAPHPFELPFENGRFPEPEYFEQNDPLLAFSAIGLDNDLVNPHADGADRIRRRERRRDAAAEAGHGGPRLAGTGRRASSARARSGERSPRRARGQLTADDDRGGERRERLPRRDPGHPGRRQDRHRDERRGASRRTRGSRRSPPPRTRGSRSRLSSSTAGTWAAKPPEARSQPLSCVR